MCSKRSQGRSTAVSTDYKLMQAPQAPSKLMKQQQVQTVDKWGKLLPNRVLTSCLKYNTARDIACSQAVSKMWKLPLELSNPLWKTRYEGDWEVETGERKEIAVGGKE